jgi:hypothetical protein
VGQGSVLQQVIQDAKIDFIDRLIAQHRGIPFIVKMKFSFSFHDDVCAYTGLSYNCNRTTI